MISINFIVWLKARLILIIELALSLGTYSVITNFFSIASRSDREIFVIHGRKLWPVGPIIAYAIFLTAVGDVFEAQEKHIVIDAIYVIFELLWDGIW